MRTRSALSTLLILIFILFGIRVFAQKTAIYSDPDLAFKKGLELFQKEKYGSAQKQFSKIINRYVTEPNNLYRIDAEYYSAICALELFNKDAELLLRNFISNHPESARIQTIYFQLGKYNYRKKLYSKALEQFAKVDIYELNNDDLAEFYFKRGYSLFEEDSIEKAKKNFFEIKDVNNKYASPATYYFGHISYTQRNYQTALQHFIKLQRNVSFGPIVPYYIAQIYFLQGKYDSAITYTLPLLDSSNTRRVPELTKIIGESYYRTNRYKGALSYLEKYKNFGSTLDRNEWYQLGYAYYKTENYNSATVCFQNATGVNDSLAQNAYYHLGDCYTKPSPYSGGSVSKMLAKNAFEMAYKIGLNATITEDALFNYAKLCYELSFSPFNEAISSLNEYISKYPNSPRLDECYKYLVNVYLSTKNYKEAMKSIERIKTLNEEMKVAYQKISYLYALQLFANTNFQDALVYLRKSTTYPMSSNYTLPAYYWQGESHYHLFEKNAQISELDSAITGYTKFLSSPGAINHSEFFATHYNMGYSYFKKGYYKESNIWFRKYVELKSNEPKEKINDAYLRVGDGFFMLKDYYNAVDYYELALKTGNRDADYALYQKSVALGLTGKKEQKISSLTELVKNYVGKSKYEAAAKFELANTYMQLGSTNSALTYYTKVVTDHPECSYTSRALLQIGLIQSKKKEYDAAIATLDKVLNSYPKTTEAFEAISAMKDVYREKGDMDAFESKLKNIPYAAVSTASLDSSNYDVAFDYYDKGDCNNAIANFDKYIKKYPNGIFLINATYYKAECDYNNRNYDAALIGYQYVIDKPYNQFSESSLVKASGINFRNKSYRSALDQYNRLAQIAEYPAHANEAKKGIMRSYWLLANYDSASMAAKNVLTIQKNTSEINAEAHLIIGRCAVEKQNYDLATEELGKVISLTKSERSAEAKYNLAYIQYLKGQYKESQKIIFELINQDVIYDYWIGKGFLLLADDYVGLNDLFNAKYALQKLIDKSASTELVTTAKERLNKIMETEKIELEKKQANTGEESQIQFNSENPKDSTLYRPEEKNK